MSELKPCPFCGKEQMTDEERGDSNNPYTGWTRLCDTHNCNAVSRNWNNRPIEDALRDRIAKLEAATRWIPVEERLPLDNQIVIGYIWFSSGVVVCSYCKLEGAFYEYWRGGQVTVTHWMPLPQPPEAE